MTKRDDPQTPACPLAKLVWGIKTRIDNIANRQTPAGEIVKVRDAREMKTIQDNRAAKCKRNGAEASSAEQIMYEYK
jgi:hypothetical protein